MRPIKLTLDWFGPYEHAEIDFTKLADAPLFLISGKTGSGKTTIFDGMSYALFDQTSGQERDATSMRSDFASPDDYTQVAFEFEHRHRHYQVIRQPKQLHTKRGGGVTEKGASVELTVFDVEGHEVDQVTRKKQADDMILELLKMNANQFSQIVLLPQGKFRQFLVAPSDDKAAILRQLFHTQLYVDWAEQLRTAQKQANQALRDQQTAIQRDVSDLIWTEPNQQAIDTGTVGKTTSELIELANQQQTDWKGQQATLDQKIIQVQQRVNQLIQQTERELQTTRMFDQRDQQTRQLAELTDQADQMKKRQRLVDQLDWIQQRAPEYTQLVQLTDDMDQMKQQLRQMDQTKRQLEPELLQLRNQRRELTDQQPQIDQTTANRVRLESLVASYQRVDELNQELKSQRQRVETLTKNLKACQDEQQAVQNQSVKVQARLDQSDQLHHDQTVTVTRQHQLERLMDQAMLVQEQKKNQQQLTLLVQQKQVEVDQADEQFQAANQAFEAINQRWIQSQIAVLSQQLAPGTPCPVCGSTEHPYPAVTTVQSVTEAEVKVARQTSDQANQLLTTAKAQLQDYQAQCQQIQTKLTSDQDQLADQLTMVTLESVAPELVIKRLTEEQNQVQATLSHLTQQLDQLDQDRQVKQQLQVKVTELTTTINQLQEQLQKAEQLQSATQATLTTVQEKLPAEFQTAGDLQVEIQRLKAVVAGHDAKLESVTEQGNKLQMQLTELTSQIKLTQNQLTDNQKKADDLRNQLHAAVVATFNVTDEAAHDQFVTGYEQLDRLAELRQAVTAYQQHCTEVQNRLTELNQQLTDRQRPDGEATKLARQAADTELTQLRAEEGDLKMQITQNERRLNRIVAGMNRQEEELTHQRELGELADVMNGNSDYSKLGLERYVLQTYLQRILVAANDQLLKLTNGRYQFDLDTGEASSKKRAGLEINVYDDNVGETRSVHTLSGGESFIAALALALALGEVIQAETGSIDVEALFIDEGFGSLDQDALNTALHSLETVEGQHRMIGIISHVSELQDQVPTQLQVISDGDGRSRVTIQTEF
ncbi:AAA family ATPase [Levilactobacillus bambusae]|uniref:Nuclease SbcCD subunit C n=1 Tax=Levilactobacillus bambusae TaxID=2024736 RepID=A0A2V1MYR4_9LACO|nr:SMC family ATPase [Levilactobacillus bambusae]PWG00151.1 SMC family ATPase [Levilactobacillus bambusae]